MYTVARFWAPSAVLQVLTELGAEMNAVRPNVFRGIRKAGDGFSCDISSSDSWSDHASEMCRFVKEFERHIEKVVAFGGQVSFDVAVEPEDRGLSVVVLDESLLHVLAAARLSLELSIYPG